MKLPQAFITASNPGTVKARIDMSAEVVLANKCPECGQAMADCVINENERVGACQACRITLPMKDSDGNAS